MEEAPSSCSLWCRSLCYITLEAATECSYYKRMRPLVKIPEILVPAFDSNERHSTRLVATFNLVATIVGGGVLSLPYAFEKCGIFLGTILMVFAAVITDRSLYLLCLCARQTGVRTYGEVGKVAFGPWMETAISGLLFVFLLFVLVAYMVLVRDIWTPIVGKIVSSREPSGNVVLFGFLLFMTPFLVQKTLYELRFNCYVGFASTSILCLALCHRALQKLVDWNEDTTDDDEILLTTSSLGDVLFAFPIIMLSFLSSFNVLPIQSALIEPTKQRVSSVISGAVTACFVLMYLLGISGYLYAGSSTKGNILLNCDHNSDFFFFLGRVGCGVTIMLALAMITLPCRDSGLEVVQTIMHGPRASLSDNAESTCATTEMTKSTFTTVHEETPLLASIIEEGHEDEEEESSRPPFDIFDNSWVHYGSTFAIIALCFAGAAAAPSVATVWSLCGSSMAFVIAFMLPAACYLQIQKRQQDPEGLVWRLFSWFLIIFSIVGSIACTAQTIVRLVWPPDDS